LLPPSSPFKEGGNHLSSGFHWFLRVSPVSQGFAGFSGFCRFLRVLPVSQGFAGKTPLPACGEGLGRGQYVIMTEKIESFLFRMTK